MKAWVLHEINTLKYEEVKNPVLKANEVLVAVKAAGVCGSDIPRIFKDGAHNMPLIPGHEFSGEVVQTGTEAKEWLHKRVGVFPLIPCKKCIACQKEKYEMCRNYSYLGSRQNGGFAEYVAVPVENVIELPENVFYEEAAMLEPMAVAVHAMGQVNVLQTDTVAVCGLGTIGLLLVMFLLEKGIQNILVIGNKDSQKEIVKKMGLPEQNYCDSKKQNVTEWIRLQTVGVGPDIFFECVGKNETFSQAVDLTSPGGKICLVGNPYGDMALEKSIYWKILRNQLTITGTWNSSFPKDWKYVLEKLEQNKIAPKELISHRYLMEDLKQGLHIMRDKTEDYVKVMMVE